MVIRFFKVRRTGPKTSAAVCVRSQYPIEILLVKTRSGRRWTFPKGKVKTAESGWAAAAREAEEEAGAKGDVDVLPLGRYRLTRRDEAPTVTAYLLRVSRAGEDFEPHRDPQWFTLPRARMALCMGRSDEEAAAVLRIIDMAVARINQA